MSIAKATSPRPRQSGAPRTSENTRQQLLNAGKKLFAKKGFDGTSVKELADEAGVNVSLVSYHFDGKEGLYRACLEEFGQAKQAAVERLLQPAQSPDEFKLRLRLFIEEVIESYREDPDFTRIVHRDVDFDVDLENSIIADVFRNHFIKAFESLVSFVKKAQKGGILRSDLDPIICSRLIIGIVMHLTRTDRMSKRFSGDTLCDDKYRDAVVDHILKLVFEGLEKERRAIRQ